jgi:glycosyltransferase involved in cell wall biosynthesis
MRQLLNINNYHYRRGGADAVYLDHAELMGARGWSNSFFSMKHEKNQPSSWSRFFVDEIEYGNGYTVIEKLGKASKTIYSFEAQRNLLGLLQEFPADIAHLHNIYHHLSPSILSTLDQQGVPAVMTAHDLKIACPAYKMLADDGICERCKGGNVLNLIQHRCIRGSFAASSLVAVEAFVQQRLQSYRKHLKRIVVPSRFYHQKFVEWGWPSEQFVHIPNFIEARRYTPRFEPGRYFLYFGRLAPEKGLMTLMRAAKAAGVPLRIAGVGPDEAALKALHSELQGDVEFMGYRSGSQLHELIAQARCVVLPSEWYENAPLTVMESFALGKPVIGARIGGIPEMVLDGQTGWTFSSRNTDELAVLLAQTADASSGPRLETMGRAARSFVESAFGPEAYALAMLSLYEDLLA